MTPFDSGCRDLIRDKRFLRYIILCLPINESVVENIIMSLYFKLQGSLYFLYEMNRALAKILEIKDSRGLLAENEVVKRKTQASLMSEHKQEDNFEHFVEKMAPLIVRLNFNKIKLRCVDYLSKLMTILEMVGQVRNPEFREAIDRED